MIADISVVLHHFILILLVLLVLDTFKFIIFSEIMLLLLYLAEIRVELGSALLIALCGIEARLVDHLCGIETLTAWLDLLVIGCCRYWICISQYFLHNLI